LVKILFDLEPAGGSGSSLCGQNTNHQKVKVCRVRILCIDQQVIPFFCFIWNLLVAVVMELCLDTDNQNQKESGQTDPGIRQLLSF
jgi:hypothetical protein